MPGPYYVDSNAAGDNTGADWTNAFTAFESARAAASTAGDFIYVAHNHSESLGADATYTFLADVRVICRNSGTDALATGAVIGAQAANYAIALNGAFDVYVYGITFRTGTNVSSSRNITIGNTDGSHFEMESCRFETLQSNSSISQIILAHSGSTANSYCKLVSCVIDQRHALHTIAIAGYVEMYQCSQGASNAAATVLFKALANGNGSKLQLRQRRHALRALFHGDPFGDTKVSDTIYADDGAQYDGTNRCSWVITTRENNCSYFTPYVSPWIDRYHSGTSAISLSLECLRDGNTTVYDNDEVWGEFSFQGNTGSTQADFANDRMALLGTPAAQTASTIAWTGGTTPGKFKLESGSITPAEIGHLRARVVVGEPNITVYVDPKIRIA
jgi:hypothetical protein